MAFAAKISDTARDMRIERSPRPPLAVREVIMAHTRPAILPYAAFALIAAISLALIAQSAHPAVGLAALADLFITAPLVFLLLSRRGGRAIWTALSLVGAGAIAAHLVLPQGLPAPVALALKAGLGAVEIAILLRVIWMARRLWRARGDFSGDALRACEEISARLVGPGRAGAILAAELATLRYALWAPRPCAGVTAAAPGAAALIWALIGASCIELIVVHILLHLWLPAAAWLLSALTAYSMLTLMAHARALPRRRHSLEGDLLILRNGLFSTAQIPIQTILADEPAPQGAPLPEGVRPLSLLGAMEPQSRVLTLSRPCTIRHSYGLETRADRIAFFCDAAEWQTLWSARSAKR